MQAYYREYLKKGIRKKKGDIEHFWERINKAEYGCWEWTGVKDKNGYGRVFFRGKQRFTHTVSWILTHGIAPENGYGVLHKCDNPPCVRPDHLFLGTQLDNMQDAKAKGRVAQGFILPQTILSPKSREEIVSLYATGHYSQKALGRIFHVSQQRVSRLIKYGY